MNVGIMRWMIDKSIGGEVFFYTVLFIFFSTFIPALILMMVDDTWTQGIMLLLSPVWLIAYYLDDRIEQHSYGS